MSEKKVLIITYYWPPSAGSGVQRWLKFAKYLPLFGWQPVVVTPKTPDFTIHDPSLQKDIPATMTVIRLPIWEPNHLFMKLSQATGKKAIRSVDLVTTKKKRAWHRLATFLFLSPLLPPHGYRWCMSMKWPVC